MNLAHLAEGLLRDAFGVFFRVLSVAGITKPSSPIEARLTIATCPQVQPAARLSTYSQETYM